MTSEGQPLQITSIKHITSTKLCFESSFRISTYIIIIYKLFKAKQYRLVMCKAWFNK